VKAELEKLIALQNLDTTIRKLEKDLESVPERRAEIEAEFDRRAFEIRALESRRDDAKHNQENTDELQMRLQAVEMHGARQLRYLVRR